MSVNNINDNIKNSAFLNFSTNSISPVAPQKAPKNKQESNAYKYMLGATALAGLVALGITGYKGYLGKRIQELLGSAEREACSIKPKTSGSPKLEDIPTRKTGDLHIPRPEDTPIIKSESTLSEKIEENIPTPKEETHVSKEEVITPKAEEVGANVEEQAPKAGQQIERADEKAKNSVSENIPKAEKAAEIVAAKLEDIVPKEMLGYLKMTKAEIEKLEPISKYSNERIISRYSNGKPKYTILNSDILGNIIKMFDEEAGNEIKILHFRHYKEFDYKIKDRNLKSILIKDGKIDYCTCDIKWNSENKALESLSYKKDCKTPDKLSEYIYDPETKIKVKDITYIGPDKNSGVLYTLNYDRITGKLIL